jgi:F0F1-type ATP synthase delta subunit
VEANALQLLDATDRARAAEFLEKVASDAPVVHISFATDPSPAFMTKIVTWLRQNIHPQLLVQIGLQPSIAAGCVVRTESKVFDFSMRQFLVEKRDLLTQAIAGMELKAANLPAKKPEAKA